MFGRLNFRNEWRTLFHFKWQKNANVSLRVPTDPHTHPNGNKFVKIVGYDESVCWTWIEWNESTPAKQMDIKIAHSCNRWKEILVQVLLLDVLEVDPPLLKFVTGYCVIAHTILLILSRTSSITTRVTRMTLLSRAHTVWQLVKLHVCVCMLSQAFQYERGSRLVVLEGFLWKIVKSIRSTLPTSPSSSLSFHLFFCQTDPSINIYRSLLLWPNVFIYFIIITYRAMFAFAHIEALNFETTRYLLCFLVS